MLRSNPCAAALRCLAVGLSCVIVSSVLAGPRIGVLLKDKSPGFWVHAENGATQAAKELGADVIIKAPPSVLDASAQPRLLAALAAEKLDVLIIAPTNPDAVEAPVAELAAKGVKIITVDTPLKEGLAHTFVGADQIAMAEAAAKVFVSLLKDGDEVALLRNNSIDRTVILREETLRKALKARPAIVVRADVYASSEKDTEDERAMVLLSKYPNVKAVFASATRGTLSTVKAVRAKNLVGKVKVVGFGTYMPEEAAVAFQDGILYGWVAQQPKELGVKSVRAAVALAKGEKVQDTIRPDFLLVTADNFRSAEAKALLNP